MKKETKPELLVEHLIRVEERTLGGFYDVPEPYLLEALKDRLSLYQSLSNIVAEALGVAKMVDAPSIVKLNERIKELETI